MGVARRYLDVRDQESGITFRFSSDRQDPSRLHIEAAHGVTVAEAVETFFSGLVGPTVWVDQKACYETFSATHVLAWLWMDQTHTRVLVITCMPQ